MIYEKNDGEILILLEATQILSIPAMMVHKCADNVAKNAAIKI